MKVFQIIPVDSIREVFEHKVFNMLLKEGAVSDDVVENIRSWHHSGFHLKAQAS
jgi:hypothetical protein